MKTQVVPFFVGSDGRLYINKALIEASTIKAVITCPARSAS